MANSELNINLKSFTPLLKGLKTMELLEKSPDNININGNTNHD